MPVANRARHRSWNVIWACGLVCLLPTLGLAEDLGLQVPEGFQVELFADDDLAHDVYNLTFNARGQLVVAGRGYVKTLIDDNHDGRADRAQLFSDSPANGAMGLCFIGSDLLCVGDAGLLRYRDRNNDGQADGPPDVFLKLKTGGEHEAHAIRRGPDGWFYLICGNTTGISKSYITLSDSPVTDPEHGVILRLSHDLKAGEVVAHGFRNAFDFDFGPAGGLYTFDSDDERDSSLPWYRPTRVFQAVPGSHAGWLSRSWKRPDYFFDMPPVAAAFGRGSPTGVCTYQHQQFPQPYQGALFVMDWTFGRVWALPWKKAGEIFETEPIEFITAKGEFGFAPTDCEVGPDGSLYVAVGGRGTRGGVYRITWTQGINAGKAAIPTTLEPLKLSLQCPQPYSSWARALWEPAASALGKDPLLAAASDQKLTPAERVRAIEILTSHFGGLSGAAAETIATDPDAEVRARLAWSLGRVLNADVPQSLWGQLLADTDPLVRRMTLETLTVHPRAIAISQHTETILNVIGDDQRWVRFAAVRWLARLRPEEFDQIGKSVKSGNWQAALTFAFAKVQRDQSSKPTLNAYAIELGRTALEQPLSPELKLEAIRLVELGLGDMAVVENVPPALQSYLTPVNLMPVDRNLDPLRAIVGQLFPTGVRNLDLELERVAAMLAIPNDSLLDRVLAQVTPESSPIDDVHHLLVASRLPVPRGEQQRDIIARGLVQIEPKLQARKLVQDTNWPDRISDLYHALVEQDPDLPAALLAQPGFGRPGHVLYLDEFTADMQPQVWARFAAAIALDPDYPWNNDVVFLFGESDAPEYIALVRQRYDSFATRSAALICLARRPVEQDRPKFIEGLASAQREVVQASLEALTELPATKAGDENVMLVKALRRLGQDKAEFPLRDQVVVLLQRNSGQKFSYQAGPAGHQAQPAAVQAWTQWALNTYPDLAAELQGGGAAELAQLQKIIQQVDWSQGDPQRGAKLFVERTCSQCHGSSTALGPSLSGVTGRFSREDLLTAILLPDRDVSPRYQATTIETTGGQVLTGMVVYESAEGLILRNSTNQTFRLQADEIESQVKQSRSLMPAGLLKDLPPQGWADLYSYLQTLGAREAAQSR